MKCCKNVNVTELLAFAVSDSTAILLKVFKRDLIYFKICMNVPIPKWAVTVM